MDSSRPPEDQNSPNAAPSKETGYTPGDTFSIRWKNTLALLSGGLTPEGRVQYKAARDLRYEQSDCERCEKFRDHLFRHSPIVRFMRENVAKLHGDLNESNVTCRRCPIDEGFQRRGGGFSPDHGIQICANEVRNRGHLEDTLAHEMVHAYDHMRFEVDFTGDSGSLRQAACSEVIQILPKSNHLRHV
ncbi:MAG: Mitochondrial inner membrane protease atp23 [Vezdaea acicularis]|nr:MAG: Mitochondrial inner membrane protease atp23 [Vezdaea acicularis]